MKHIVWYCRCRYFKSFELRTKNIYIKYEEGGVSMHSDGGSSQHLEHLFQAPYQHIKLSGHA